MFEHIFVIVAVAMSWINYFICSLSIDGQVAKVPLLTEFIKFPVILKGSQLEASITLSLHM